MSAVLEPRLLKAEEVCRYLSISPNTLRRMVAQGLLPPAQALSGKVVRWDKRQIDAYLDNKAQ